jgi:hypothetical protein
VRCGSPAGDFHLPDKDEDARYPNARVGSVPTSGYWPK